MGFDDDERRQDLELAAKLELLAAALRSPVSPVVASPLQDISPEFVRELLQSVELRLEERLSKCPSAPTSGTSTPRRSATQPDQRRLNFHDCSRASFEESFDWNEFERRLREDKFNEMSPDEPRAGPSAWPDPLMPAQEVPEASFDWDMFRNRLHEDKLQEVSWGEPCPRAGPSPWPEPLRQAQEIPSPKDDVDWDEFMSKLIAIENDTEMPEAQPQPCRSAWPEPLRPAQEISPPKHFGDIDWEVFKKRLKEVNEDCAPNNPPNRALQIPTPDTTFDSTLSSVSQSSQCGICSKKLQVPSQCRFAARSQAPSQCELSRTSNAPSKCKLQSQTSQSRVQLQPSQCRPFTESIEQEPPCRRQPSPLPPPCIRQPSLPCRQQPAPLPLPNEPPCVPCSLPPAKSKQVFQSRIPRFQGLQKARPQQARPAGPPPSRIPRPCPEKLAGIRRIPRTFIGSSRIPRPKTMNLEGSGSDLSDGNPCAQHRAQVRFCNEE